MIERIGLSINVVKFFVEAQPQVEVHSFLSAASTQWHSIL